MLKKIAAVALLTIFACPLAIAQDLSGLGFIDVQKVFKGYKQTEKSQGELAKEEASFKKEFEDSQKKLADAEKNNKSKEELEKMKNDLEAKLAPKRDALMKLNEQLTVKLQGQIVKAVDAVAKKMGIETVLDKQVVIVGGSALTEMVLNELNK